MASNKTRNSGVTNAVVRPVQMPVPPVQQSDDQQDDAQQNNAQPGQGGTPPRDPEQLLDWFKTATQADADAWLQSVNAEPIDDRQQDDGITRFFNQIGWTSREAEVMDESSFQQAYQAAGRPQLMYHADRPVNGIGGREFIAQYMGQSKDAAGNVRRHYLSNGIYGNGTYYASTASESSYYGTSQFRGFLNSNAKVISYSSLLTKVSNYCSKYPAFKSVYNKITGGYSGSESDARMSVMAAMFGYNVIHNGRSYISVLDRSATTVSTMTKRASYGMSDW